jgi:RNA polymerase sigma-70 factor (ECF subfamily)
MTNSIDDDTDHLLDRVHAGDDRARQELFERFRPRLKTMVRCRMDARLMARVDPSDVVQDCLTTAHLRLPKYLDSRPVKFYPWLRQIAWSRLIELHRLHVTAQRRSVYREITGEAELSDESAVLLASQLVASDTGPLQRLARREMADRVQCAVGRLSPSLRDALLLRYLEQLSAEEAAEVAGITQVAFKQRLVRALKQLRELLADEREDER